MGRQEEEKMAETSRLPTGDDLVVCRHCGHHGKIRVFWQEGKCPQCGYAIERGEKNMTLMEPKMSKGASSEPIRQ